jgi:NADPH-dependent F420 reductase
MKIAIIGGTGDIGEGLALRLAKQNDVIIGSRDAAKAQEAANNYNKVLKDRGMKDDIRGMSNEDAAKTPKRSSSPWPGRRPHDSGPEQRRCA